MPHWESCLKKKSARQAYNRHNVPVGFAVRTTSNPAGGASLSRSLSSVAQSAGAREAQDGCQTGLVLSLSLVYLCSLDYSWFSFKVRWLVIAYLVQIMWNLGDGSRLMHCLFSDAINALLAPLAVNSVARYGFS